MTKTIIGHKKKFCPITTTKSIAELNPENILSNAFPQGTPKVWGIIGGPHVKISQ